MRDWIFAILLVVSVMTAMLLFPLLIGMIAAIVGPLLIMVAAIIFFWAAIQIFREPK